MQLGISITAMKQLCRKLGIIRWPYRRQKKDKSARAAARQTCSSVRASAMDNSMDALEPAQTLHSEVSSVSTRAGSAQRVDSQSPAGQDGFSATSSPPPSPPGNFGAYLRLSADRLSCQMADLAQAQKISPLEPVVTPTIVRPLTAGPTSFDTPSKHGVAKAWSPAGKNEGCWRDYANYAPELCEWNTPKKALCNNERDESRRARSPSPQPEPLAPLRSNTHWIPSPCVHRCLENRQLLLCRAALGESFDFGELIEKGLISESVGVLRDSVRGGPHCETKSGAGDENQGPSVAHHEARARPRAADAVKQAALQVAAYVKEYGDPSYCLYSDAAGPQQLPGHLAFREDVADSEEDDDLEWLVFFEKSNPYSA